MFLFYMLLLYPNGLNLLLLILTVVVVVGIYRLPSAEARAIGLLAELLSPYFIEILYLILTTLVLGGQLSSSYFYLS